MRTPVILAVLLGASLTASAEAQVEPDSVILDARCRLAVQTITTGTPGPLMSRSLALIHRCGTDGGAALATAIRAKRTSTDISELDQLTAPTQVIVDAGVFQAAIDLLTDAGASEQARVFAARTLLWSINNSLEIRYEDMVGPPVSLSPCARSVMTENGSYVLTPLPADARTRAISAGEQFWKSESESQAIRRATACLARLGLPSAEREP